VNAWRRIRALALPLIVLGYLATGFYTVDSDARAVAFIAGRALEGDVRPGIHWNVPWPLGRTVVQRTSVNFVMPIGYRLLDRTDVRPISSLWLTGDTNIIEVTLDVQYVIRELRAFLLGTENPRELLRQIGERTVTAELVRYDIDALLTSERQAVQRRILQTLQRDLDARGVPLGIQNVVMREVAPPTLGDVRATFKQVQDAISDRQRLVDEANTYRGSTLAAAQGEAERRIQSGEATRRTRVELARGETERFLALAAAHAEAPELTEQRLFLETMEELLPSMSTYIVEPGAHGTVHLRIVDR